MEEVMTTGAKTMAAAPRIWTSVLVADRLREAAETLKRLPDYRPGRIYRGAWPDILRNPREAYGYTPLEANPGPPSARAITGMDEVVLDWMALLTANEVKILWGWALGVPAQAVAARFRVHRATIHRRRIAGFRKLAIRLNANGVLVREAELDGQ